MLEGTIAPEVFGPQVICVASPTFRSALPLKLGRVQRKEAGSSGKAKFFVFFECLHIC